MSEAGNGRSIIFTTSGAVSRGTGNLAHYSSAKSGLVGLCRELTVDVAAYRIRVNTLQPTWVHTVIFDHQAAWELFTSDREGAPLAERRQGMLDIMSQLNILNVPWVEPEDLADGVLFLASDEARMVTGGPFRVDAGFAAH